MHVGSKIEHFAINHSKFSMCYYVTHALHTPLATSKMHSNATWESFQKEEKCHYDGVHGYIAIPICCLGIIFNVVNIVGWSNQPRTTAANVVLRLLSLVDLLVVATYLPIAIYIFEMTDPSTQWYHSKPGMYIVLVSNHLFIQFSKWSTWIAMILALVRFMNVTFNRNAWSIPTVKKVTFVLFVILQTEALVYYFYYEVRKCKHERHCSGYWIFKTELAKHTTAYHNTMFTLFVFSRGLIPCVMFVVLCGLTIYVVVCERGRRQPNNAVPNGNKTTAMLFLVALLFFVTMFPVCLYPFFLLMMSPRKTEYFWFLECNVDKMVIDVNILALPQLINCSLNICVYAIMSPEFRKACAVCNLFHRRRGYTEIESNINGDINSQEAQIPIRNNYFF